MAASKVEKKLKVSIVGYTLVAILGYKETRKKKRNENARQKLQNFGAPDTEWRYQGEMSAPMMK